MWYSLVGRALAVYVVVLPSLLGASNHSHYHSYITEGGNKNNSHYHSGIMEGGNKNNKNITVEGAKMHNSKNTSEITQQERLILQVVFILFSA